MSSYIVRESCQNLVVKILLSKIKINIRTVYLKECALYFYFYDLTHTVTYFGVILFFFILITIYNTLYLLK